MSLWGKLAGLAGIVASPFTGGTSLSWVPAAFGAGAAVDGMAGGDDDAGGGMDLGSVWGSDGLFTGESRVNGADGAGGSNDIYAKLLKYGLPAAAGAIHGAQSNSQAQQVLDVQRARLAEEIAARKQNAALDESKLDPFRGYMAQARDVGKLDMQAEGNFASSPVQLDAKYGAGVNAQPEQFYTPSAMMRTVARGNREAVASGKTVPTMTDPANYGKMPVGSYGAGDSGAPPATSGAGGPATAILAALRAKGLLPQDDTQQPSPWLA